MTEQHVVRELPRVIASMQITMKNHPNINYTFDGEVPEALMDEYEKVVGNGLAKVTVSADMSIKDFGTGASGMCSITLTCNQDTKTIEQALDLAGTMARGFAQENRQRAENELKMILEQRNPQTTGRPNFG